MPGSLIWFTLFVIAALGARAGARALRRAAKDDADARFARTVLRVVAALLAVAAVLTIACTSYNPVGTRDIGIVTSFGQPDGHLSPGFNLTWPWQQVTSMDEAVQLTDETFTVRIAGGQTAQATVQVRWHVVPAAADDVFQNYRNSTSGVENGLLVPELNAATNAALDGYDPLTPLARDISPGTPGNPSTTQLASLIQGTLVPRLGGDIAIVTLVLKPLVYDDTVQSQVNKITAQAAQTDVAQQAVKTATAQAAANKIAEGALASNPLVLVQQCLNALADGKITPPAGFSCWPGSGSGIVIPSK